MLFSIALIFLLGIIIGGIFNKLKLPSLLGMIITGVILGPYALNVLDDNILLISSDLRKMALVIILTRAGLALNIKDLKKVGRPAILLCFVPAVFEILACTFLAPMFFKITTLEGAIMGTVLAAVSPAVIVPRMLKLMEDGYGKKNSIPQMIMAGASVDDIFVIVLFTSFIGIATGEENFTLATLLQVPISIILGIIIGLASGYVLYKIFKKIHIRDSIKILLIISVSFLLITLEDVLKEIVPISGLLAIMSIGIAFLKLDDNLSKRMSSKYNKLWVGAEVLLFVLVGATVNIEYAIKSGVGAIILILVCLMFRMVGVYLSLIKTKLSTKERIFCMIAYSPKATVQAAIGAMPLAIGLNCGEIVLTVAVLSIVITAPLGAIGIDNTYYKLLTKI